MGEKNAPKKFYDVHMHAFNLAHPNLSAFIKRFLWDRGPAIVLYIAGAIVVLYVLFTYFGNYMTAVLGGLLGFVLLLTFLHVACPSKLSRMFFSLIARIFKRHLNLLALMENDLGNYFLLTEQVLGRDLQGGKIPVNGTVYDRIVLTPLMMDFGSKNIVSRLLPYGALPIRKPIAQQVTDLFNGIRTYVRKSPDRMFEIYPFLGVNPQGYSLPELQDLLDKYFGQYERSAGALHANMGGFNGNIDDLGGNFFAGIKVYPPLGFDPWPEDGADWQEQRKKVEWLYDFCCCRNIPVTTHCSDGGFIVDSLFVSHRRTTPEKWAKVLAGYPALKLNLAHMGEQKSLLSRSIYGIGKRRWGDTVFELIAKYDNVYTDFSCMEFDDKSYAALRQLINFKSWELEKILAGKPYTLRDKVLFGSDFMINLQWIGSYNDYLDYFAKTKHLTGPEKELFCSGNPERFLF